MVNPIASPDNGSVSQDNRVVLGMRVDATSYRDATNQIINWARSRASRYVCVANVHMTMEAYDDPAFRLIVNEADLVTPDGMPLVWALRALGVAGASRVRGPDLVLHLARAASAAEVPVSVYGGSEDVALRFAARLMVVAPGLDIRLVLSPPFRALSDAEVRSDAEKLDESGASLVFVGLGCPKQERWMAAARPNVRGVLIGVGAAFDLHAGTVRQAPRWLQAAGFEWFFRLMQEPRRLWYRYAKTNPRFVVLCVAQILRQGISSSSRRPE